MKVAGFVLRTTMATYDMRENTHRSRARSWPIAFAPLTPGKTDPQHETAIVWILVRTIWVIDWWALCEVAFTFSKTGGRVSCLRSTWPLAQEVRAATG